MAETSNNFRGQISGSSNDTAQDTSAGATLLHVLSGHTGTIWSMAWSPDERWLASGSQDGTVRLWDTVHGVSLHTFDHEDVFRVAWSPNGQRLASGSLDNTIRLWDPIGGTLLHTLTGHSNQVRSIAWSPNGQWLASTSSDKTVRLWDPIGGTLLHTLTGHEGSVWTAAWSPDSRWLASVSEDKTVRLWDLGNWMQVHTITGHAANVLDVAWSPDGHWLASSSDDGTVRLWNPQNGRQLHVLTGHTQRVQSVSWSLDGHWLASGSQDGTVRLWDPIKGTQQHVLEGHKYGIHSLTWLSGGSLLVSFGSGSSGPYDGEIHVWKATNWTSIALLKDLRYSFSVTCHPRFLVLATGGTKPERYDLNVWNLEHLLYTTHAPETGHSTHINDRRDQESIASILQGKRAAQDFDVFLCHHAQDKPAVKRIGEQLKLHGLLPWLDEWELRPGLPWQELLEHHIAQIKTVAVFVGKSGIGPWQRQELNAFLREFVDRGCPVIPVLLPDAPREPALPVFLRAMTWVDFRSQNPDPKQLLLWGITGKREIS